MLSHFSFHFHSNNGKIKKKKTYLFAVCMFVKSFEIDRISECELRHISYHCRLSNRKDFNLKAFVTLRSEMRTFCDLFCVL